MSKVASTYASMAEIFSQFLSHHSKGPLTPHDTLSIGVLAALTHILHGTNIKQQWTDIHHLANHGLEIEHAAEEADLFSRQVTPDHGHGSEVCSPAKGPEDDDEEAPPKYTAPLINRHKIQVANSVGRLLDRSPHAFCAQDHALIRKARHHATKLTEAEFIQLMQLTAFL